MITDTLPDPVGVDCQTEPVKTYDINKIGRYVRFFALTFYHTGPALNYIHVDFDYPEGISNEHFICPGIFSPVLVF